MKRNVEKSVMWTPHCGVMFPFVVLLQNLFGAIYAVLSIKTVLFVIYSLLCGENLNQKLCLWRKKDKYQAWAYSRSQDNQKILHNFSLVFESIQFQAAMINISQSFKKMQKIPHLNIIVTVIGWSFIKSTQKFPSKNKCDIRRWI